MGDSVDAAARALRAGKLVVYPTDTLWGLGASATSPEAVRRLVEAKERPGGLPLSVAVSSLEELEPWAEFTAARRQYLRRCLPGPVTVLLPASALARRRLATGIVGPEGSIGLRVPDHPVARELARRAGPITSTSANRHGQPPARSLASARRVFGRAVAYYLAGGPAPSGRASRLADLRGPRPRIVDRA